MPVKLSIMRSAVAAVVVGVAAGKYNCPGSSSFSHASMEVTVDVDADCTSVQQEIEARASGSWVDPHNGGIYSVLSSSSGLINTQRHHGMQLHIRLSRILHQTREK